MECVWRPSELVHGVGLMTHVMCMSLLTGCSQAPHCHAGEEHVSSDICSIVHLIHCQLGNACGFWHASNKYIAAQEMHVTRQNLLWHLLKKEKLRSGWCLYQILAVSSCHCFCLVCKIGRRQLTDSLLPHCQPAGHCIQSAFS